MSLNLNVTADTAEELVAAIKSIAAQFGAPVSVTVAAPAAEQIATALKRGRPAKSAQPDAPTESVQPAASPAPAAVEEPAAAPVKADPVAAAGASPPSKDTVQQALILVVQKIGKAACTELCMKYGKPNLSALPESVYASLLADARKALGAA